MRDGKDIKLCSALYLQCSSPTELGQLVSTAFNRRDLILTSGFIQVVQGIQSVSPMPYKDF